jgi:hypothetical protein
MPSQTCDKSYEKIRSPPYPLLSFLFLISPCYKKSRSNLYLYFPPKSPKRFISKTHSNTAPPHHPPLPPLHHQDIPKPYTSSTPHPAMPKHSHHPTISSPTNVDAFPTAGWATKECPIRAIVPGQVNNLTAKSVLAGEKNVLFGKYILSFYVGIVHYILCDKNLAHQNLLTSTKHKLANINLLKNDTISTLYLHHQWSKLRKNCKQQWAS